MRCGCVYFFNLLKTSAVWHTLLHPIVLGRSISTGVYAHSVGLDLRATVGTFRTPLLCRFPMKYGAVSLTTAFMLMQTGWIQASCRVTRRLTWDPTCLLLSPSFPIKNRQNLKVLKSRRQYNLFLENYPAFKGLIFNFIWVCMIVISLGSYPPIPPPHSTPRTSAVTTFYAKTG